LYMRSLSVDCLWYFIYLYRLYKH